MKVLMLGWELPPHHSGGMGVACYEMCREISATGIDIEFIVPYTADHGPIDFMDVVPAHPQSVDAVKFAGGVYTPEYYEFHNTVVFDEQLDLKNQHDLFAHNVARIAEAREFDIIHAHDWLTFRAGVLAKRASGKPLIAHVHATQYDQSGGGYGNPLAREIEYAGLAEADMIFAVSQFTKDILVREYGIDHTKIQVVHNSMEIGESQSDSSDNVYRYLEVMKQNGYKVAVNVGRKTLQKGLTHLLEATARAVAVEPKLLLVLAGSGDQEQELIEYSAEIGISQHVIHVGWVSGKKWRDTFRIADMFVMPSVSEPFGLVALEAIGFGAPAIISKQSGVAEVLNSCLETDFWDTDKLAEYMVQLSRHDSLRDELWRNAYEEYEQLSWRDSAQTMHSHYHGVAERCKAA